MEWNEKDEETSRVIWGDDKEVPLEAEPSKGGTVMSIRTLTIFILFYFIFSDFTFLFLFLYFTSLERR